MPQVKTSTHCGFRMPISLKQIVDEAVEKTDTDFSKFIRDGIRMKLDSLGIEY